MRTHRQEVVVVIGSRKPGTRVIGKIIGSLALVLLLCPLTAVAWQVAPASQSSPGFHSPAGASSAADTPMSPGNELKLQHLREDDRHKRLLADTAKLVELTNELKTELDKASKDELSLDVVRKAAEIEKLAHDVKERMKS